jgi:hypothetical protein
MNKNANMYGIIAVLITLIIVLGIALMRKNNHMDYIVSNNVTSNQVSVQSNVTNQQTNNNTQNSGAVSLVLDSAFARSHKTLLTEGFSKPANFNKTMRVVEIGCGSGCSSFAVVDKATGQVYEVPIGNDYGSFGGQVPTQYTVNSDVITIIGSPVKYFKFVNGQFTQQ